MDWERISANWAHWKGRIRERWGRLTDDELDAIAGERERLVNRIQRAYELGPRVAERQLRNWERNLAVDEFDESDLVLDDEDVPRDVNGRG